MIYYKNIDGSIIHQTKTAQEMADYLGTTLAALRDKTYRTQQRIKTGKTARRPYVENDEYKENQHLTHKKKVDNSDQFKIVFTETVEEEKYPPIGSKVYLWEDINQKTGIAKRDDMYQKNEYTVVKYYRHCIDLVNDRGIHRAPCYWEFFKRQKGKV